MKKMAFVDLCNYSDWPMGGMIQYELMILETLGRAYEIDLWGVSVDGKANTDILINNKIYPLHIFCNVKTKNRLIPNYWKGLLVGRVKKHFLKYDVIYVHTGSCFVSLATILKSKNMLFVYHQHGLQYLEDFSLKTMLQKPFMNRAQRLADFSFVVTGEAELEEYINEKNPSLKNKIIAIGSPIESMEFDWNKDIKRIESRKVDKEYQFIYCGRLTSIKKVPNLVEIFALFCKRGYERSSLLIVGDGEERSAVSNMIKRYGLQEYVHLIGMVSSSKVKEYLKQADFYITASRGEGVSVAVLEAYAAGVPVVCFPVRGLKHQVKNAQTGFIAKEMTSEAFVQAIENAITNQLELSRNCINESEKYQKEKIGSQIIDELEKRQKYAFD